MERCATINPPKARRCSHDWRETKQTTLQKRERRLGNGGKSKVDNSNYENNISQMEQNAGRHPPKARTTSHKWSKTQDDTLQKREQHLTNGGKTQDDTLQKRERGLTIGAEGRNKTSKSENNISRLEHLKAESTPFTRAASRKWSNNPKLTLQMREKSLANGAASRNKASKCEKVVSCLEERRKE